MTQITFWDHLEELRWSIIRIIAVWIIVAIGYFVAMPYIFDNIIIAPCSDDFVLYELLRSMSQHLGIETIAPNGFDIELVNINLTAPLFIHISTAFALSIVTTMPYLLYEIWRFIAPALTSKEKRSVKGAFTFGSIMFFMGVALGYFVIYPLTLRFLTSYQLSSTINNMLSITSYIDNFIMLTIAMGIAFEMPTLLWLLSLMGIVTREMPTKYRRHAFVIIVIVAAVITPTGDPFTLAIVTLPLYMLYELSLLVVKRGSSNHSL